MPLSIPQSSPTNSSSQRHSPNQDPTTVERRAMKLSGSMASGTKRHSIAVVRLLRGMLESSSTTIPASAAIKAFISYMKIKLKSCRTADFCQNASISSSLNPKLATEGMLLQTTTTPPSQEVLVICIAHIQTTFFQELFFLHIGKRGEQLSLILSLKHPKVQKKSQYI